MSTGLLYSYYANLSDLMRSLWLTPIAELGGSLAAVEQAESDPVTRIELLLAAYVEFTIAHDETHRGLLLFVRPPDSTTEVNDDPDDLMLFSTLRRAVEQGQAEGSIREGDARELAQLLWSGVHGALALPINVDTYDLTDGPVMATEMIAALIRAVANPPAAAPTDSPNAPTAPTTPPSPTAPIATQENP